MGITPVAQISQLLHFGVVVLHVVFDWQAGGIIDSDVASQAEQNASTFKGQQSRIGAIGRKT